MSYEDVLDALGEPTRRRILERLRGGGCHVQQLADGLPVSRPAVSKHLRVLKDAGLVVEEKRGTRRIYRIDERALREAETWLRGFWDEALGRFAAAAEAADHHEEETGR